jgi:hypothetical protein
MDFLEHRSDRVRVRTRVWPVRILFTTLAQAAFIQGWYILDNVLAANEIIYFAKINK